MASTEADGSRQGTAVIVIGMAGSGKTTLLQRLNAHLAAERRPPYVLNLDPAVGQLPFTPNIDIRDTVDYHEVMKQYNLGPNGGILTALNLFTTKFDQVLNHVEKRATSVDYVLLDTPGQIEIFTWSASGAIITDALASALPTVVAYVIDTPRTASPVTFMSNMLYACSIMYKTRLPFILVFNKIDVQPHEFALEWMRDFEKFQEALISRKGTGGDEEPGYMDSLMNSMSLLLDEFYKHLRAVGISAMTGEGVQDFFDSVQSAREEYLTDYKPQLEKAIKERQQAAETRKSDDLARLAADLNVSGEAKPAPPKTALQNMMDVNQDEADEDDDDGEVIDRSARHEYYDFTESRRTKSASSKGVVDADGTLWPSV